MMVFVLDENKSPLMPMHPARARKLLKQGRAVVHKRVPFTIRLKTIRLFISVEKDNKIPLKFERPKTQPVRIKIDPGSRITGIAIVREAQNAIKVLHLAELYHKSYAPVLDIKKRLDQRRAYRRRRRSANLRYRKPRFLNRRRGKGWLPPSLMARVHNIESWVERYKRLVPISAISVETVRFDTQKLQNPEIKGVEYQQGELFGYEVKEYLLEKWGRKCAYCGKENIPLEIEHIVPKGGKYGGTDRVANLTLACRRCNEKKGNRTAAEFGFPEIQEKARQTLKHAAIATATRWAVWEALGNTALLMEMGTGARTKYNRIRLNIPKAHCLDAVCVGASTSYKNIELGDNQILTIKTIGRGLYKRTIPDKYGFPRGTRMRQKFIEGFKSGDMVRAVIASGNKDEGVHIGYITVRHNGIFSVEREGKHIVGGASVRKHKFNLLQRGDGYRYEVSEIGNLGF